MVPVPAHPRILTYHLKKVFLTNFNPSRSSDGSMRTRTSAKKWLHRDFIRHYCQNRTARAISAIKKSQRLMRKSRSGVDPRSTTPKIIKLRIRQQTALKSVKCSTDRKPTIPAFTRLFKTRFCTNLKIEIARSTTFSSIRRLAAST